MRKILNDLSDEDFCEENGLYESTKNEKSDVLLRTFTRRTKCKTFLTNPLPSGSPLSCEKAL